MNRPVANKYDTSVDEFAFEHYVDDLENYCDELEEENKKMEEEVFEYQKLSNKALSKIIELEIRLGSKR